jgi:hypothetical protein
MNRFRAAVAAATALLFARAAWAAGVCEHPHQMGGFQTCANVEQAAKEGQFILYSRRRSHSRLSNRFLWSSRRFVGQ